MIGGQVDGDAVRRVRTIGIVHDHLSVGLAPVRPVHANLRVLAFGADSVLWQHHQIQPLIPYHPLFAFISRILEFWLVK